MQGTKAMNAGTGGSYNLTTWQGHKNLKVLILEITLQDGPVELLPAAFGLTSARTKGNVLGSSIDSKIMKLAYATVCKTMFTSCAPIIVISRTLPSISSSKSLLIRTAIWYLRLFPHII